MEHPPNAYIAQLLEEMADHLELGGARYPARAYRGAARTIRRLPTSAGALAMAGSAQALRGVGRSIEARIVELCETGSIAELERMRERTPSALMVLPRFRGVSQAKAERIAEQLGIRTLDDVAEAADDGRLLTVAGIGPATVDSIRDGLLTLETEPEELAEGMLRSHAARAAGDVRAVLEAVVPGLAHVHVCGQLTRGFEVIDVLDIVAVVDDAPAATTIVREQLDDRGWHTSSEDAVVDDECLTFALHGST
ncbi:MAG: polX, partial [Thermoleophilia bacterium]|nr:polX [Thermoleophilia bacterium]